MTQSLFINDANSEKGTLKGLVHHVPLSISNIFTYVNIFIEKYVLFNLLLGRS